MPSLFVHGVPPVDRPDAVVGLRRTIIGLTRDDPSLRGTDDPITVFVPADRDTLEIGETIVVTSVGLAHRRWDARDHEALQNAILNAVRDWVLRHLPKCRTIEVNLDHHHDISLPPARWRRDDPQK